MINYKKQTEIYKITDNYKPVRTKTDEPFEVEIQKEVTIFVEINYETQRYKILTDRTFPNFYFSNIGISDEPKDLLVLQLMQSAVKFACQRLREELPEPF